MDFERGLIWSRCGPFVARSPGARFVRSVRVDYATTVPVAADVQQAYADLVGHWYRHVKTMVASHYQNVTQQTFGDTTAIFSKDQINGLPLPPDVVRLQAPYREAPL
jgi:trehalose-6-phosphatase